MKSKISAPLRYIWLVMSAGHTSDTWVRNWLLAGVVMVFFQVVLGGVTRLTGSGLSITRWDIVTGTIPPLSAQEWEVAFAAYQQTPQYQKINAGMSLADFKFIFFWEYVHRLWARIMGFVFMIPFLVFLLKGRLHKRLLNRLIRVVGLAALAASFGWIMVASGLRDRPWVNAYALTVHLSIGTTLFIYLLYTWLKEGQPGQIYTFRHWRTRTLWFLVLAGIQLAFGGLMAGMKAALLYPTWPTMYGEWIPKNLLIPGNWTLDNFLLYDQTGFMPSLVQAIHRNLGYIILVYGVIFLLAWRRELPRDDHYLGWMLLGIILVQVSLGILTLTGSIGSVPVFYGAAHQGLGILFLAYLFYIRLKINTKHID